MAESACHDTIIHTVALVSIVDGRLLMVRPRDKKAFYLPGGKIDPGESDVDALVRELGEELAVHTDPAALRYLTDIDTSAYGHGPGVRVRMRCYLGGFQGDPTPNAEIEEVRYLSPTDYVDLPETAPAVLDLIDELRSRHLIGTPS
ncbi:NUDIX hydrolase [Pseudonocardia spinosispora]|uniref:NUDIX hydrolase n=1 Tax=Pseudonocardia spinosispora TaxID=103441 RepID=UPI000415B79A|nr:NUDIX domain-containing protein [Pseudonocardia spinosispora]